MEKKPHAGGVKEAAGGLLSKLEAELTPRSTQGQGKRGRQRAEHRAMHCRQARNVTQQRFVFFF